MPTMMVIFSILLIMQLFALNYGMQLKTVDGDSLWLATIDDSYDCDEMTNIIKGITENHNERRMLAGEDVFIEELKGGDEDCFVEFSGTYEMAVTVNNTIGVIDVDPDNEIFIDIYNWGIDRSDQDKLPLNKNNYMPSFTGDGQTVYIIDTGIFKDHDDLSGRASYGGDFVNEGVLMDKNGHGTHCSSIAVGTNYGISHNAKVIGVKVLSGSGSGSISNVIKGVQWAVKHAGSKTSVLSLSLGGGSSTAMNKVVEVASKTHIVVVAAGNSNMDACSASPAGAGENVITVGSTTIKDSRSGFSNYGKCVDIFGPGSKITAAFIGSSSTVKVLSGTSMAAPYISGIALQILEKNNGDFSRSYNDLLATGIYGVLKGDLGDGSPNIIGIIPSYTGPPTVPTLNPTMPPTLEEPRLCMGNGNCYEFAPSSFGGNEWSSTYMTHNTALSSEDKFMCAKTNENFKNKIVLVERGNCFFHEKVKNCENQGAQAVIIVNDNNGRIFSPSFYGNDKTKISSCMVSKNTGDVMYNAVGEELKWGRFDDIARPIPTKTPAVAPSNQCDSFRSSKCKRVKRCYWGKSSKTCNKRN
jgi:hypothetical protein